MTRKRALRRDDGTVGGTEAAAREGSRRCVVAWSAPAREPDRLRQAESVLRHGGSARTPAPRDRDAVRLASEHRELRSIGRAALALTLRCGAVTAVGNDNGYDSLFERPLRGLAVMGDVLVRGINHVGGREIYSPLRAARDGHRDGWLLVGREGRRSMPATTFCSYRYRNRARIQ